METPCTGRNRAERDPVKPCPLLCLWGIQLVNIPWKSYSLSITLLAPPQYRIVINQSTDLKTLEIFWFYVTIPRVNLHIAHSYRTSLCWHLTFAATSASVHPVSGMGTSLWTPLLLWDRGQKLQLQLFSLGFLSSGTGLMTGSLNAFLQFLQFLHFCKVVLCRKLTEIQDAVGRWMSHSSFSYPPCLSGYYVTLQSVSWILQWSPRGSCSDDCTLGWLCCCTTEEEVFPCWRAWLLTCA